MSAQTITLNNGVKMPVLGLGVYQVKKGHATEDTVLSALKAGYRLIDTAAYYANEHDVGAAIRKSGIPREEIFVTTKLHPLIFCNFEKHFLRSLRSLSLSYIDLYLIHWPFFRTRAAWQTLEKVYKQGYVRAIGVSNFTIKHLDDTIHYGSIIPAVNQVEFHPFRYNAQFISYCTSKGIAVEAHSPLTHGKRLGSPIVQMIAKKYRKSTAQILLRWSIQHGLITIPKTTSENHMRENMQIFDFALDAESMSRLDGLNENYHAAMLSRLIDYRE